MPWAFAVGIMDLMVQFRHGIVQAVMTFVQRLRTSFSGITLHYTFLSASHLSGLKIEFPARLEKAIRKKSGLENEPDLDSR